MKKITIYAHDELEGATDEILKTPNELLVEWLCDHDLEVVNIRCEDINNELEALDPIE